jgi:opacity protein-like surface antigen
VRHVRTIAVWAVFYGVGGTSVYSQQVQPVTTGNIEAGLFVGESYGLDRFRPMFGGNVAYGATRLLFPFVEASYLPGLSRDYVGGTSVTQYNIDMTDVHGGIHFRIVKGNSRFVPYLVGGLGMVRSSNSQVHLYTTNPSTGAKNPVGGPPIAISSNVSFAVNAGAGVRFSITERIGMRLEFKAFIPTSAPTGVSNDVFYRLAIGPYLQLR